MGAQMLKKPEAPRAARKPGNPAFGISHVAEDEGISRAGLGTGRLHLAVLDQPPLGLRVFLRPADALDAEGALFHHPAGPNGDIRRKLVLERGGPGMLMVVKIKDTDCIGAVVPAVARAHTAVVDLAVQTVGIVVACINGADRLAWRVMAMLAEHGQEAHPHVGVLAHPEPLDAKPVHVTALGNLLLFAYGNIVFRLTRDHTGTAAGAAVKVNHHSPLIGARHYFHVIESFQPDIAFSHSTCFKL